MADEMKAPTPRKMDFKTALRYVRELKRMDAQKAQVPSEATQDKQDCAAVDDQVIHAVMRQYGDGQQPTDSATEFAYSSQQMK